jgi:aspartate oxidase
MRLHLPDTATTSGLPLRFPLGARAPAERERCVIAATAVSASASAFARGGRAILTGASDAAATRVASTVVGGYLRRRQPLTPYALGRR